MKKISAAFDGLKFSQTTLEYAISLSAKSQALLSGIFLSDLFYHSFNLYDMLGSQGISQTKLKHLMEKDEGARAKAVHLFKKSCKKAQVSYTVHLDDRFAIDDLLQESIYSDLLLIGAGETMSRYMADTPAPFVRELLAGAACPILVLPPAYHEIERIAVLYDGHPSSVFAIKMLNYLLPEFSGLPVEIVYAGSPDSSGELPGDVLFKEFIKCHYPAAVYTCLAGDANNALTAHLQKTSPGTLVVMGAYNRGAVSRMFKASMADKLIRSVNAPVFIAHN